MPHPTTLIRHGQYEAEVDEQVAALVLALWRSGIDTASACQDEGESNAEVGGPPLPPGQAYIEFVSLHDAIRFYDAVAAGAPSKNLYERMTNLSVRNAWEARIAVYDSRLTADRDDQAAAPAFTAGVVRVRFPASDITAITAALERS